MLDFRLHVRAVFLALRLGARSRAGKALLPARLTGSGARPLSRRAREQAVLASRRAVARFCSPDSCLTRSIVLFQLLEHRHAAKLELGFRPGSEIPSGHAWVTVDGEPLGEREADLETFTT